MIHRLQQKLTEHEIQYFTATELSRFRRWGKVVCPPEELWDNIIPTVTIADAIREVWAAINEDGRVNTNSGFRNDEYNTYVGGGPGSEHVVFKAMDISPANGKITLFRGVVTAVVNIYRRAGYNVGLGYYNTFCHIDTNAVNKRVNRAWDLRTAA